MATRVHNKMIVLLVTFGLAAIALAEIPEPADPVESEIAAAQLQSQWVRRVQEASDLMGAGKTSEALAAFQSLQQDMPTLDTEGLVALAIGDCQFQLKQYEKARAAYGEAAQLYPALNETIWVRLVETELSMGKLNEATARLQQVLAGGAAADQKAWASLRLGTIQETQAIQLLGKAEQGYRQAMGLFKDLPEHQTYGQRWGKAHAEDLKDVSTQLQVALGQLTERHTHIMPIYWPGPSQASLPGAEVSKVKISGQVSRAAEGKDPKGHQAKNKDAKETVELTVEKDGKVEVTLAGKKIELDAATQRQIVKHLQYTLRMAGQASQEAADPKAEKADE
jgi:tetratricopeptide (TPR) repeat protein